MFALDGAVRDLVRRVAHVDMVPAPSLVEVVKYVGVAFESVADSSERLEKMRDVHGPAFQTRVGHEADLSARAWSSSRGPRSDRQSCRAKWRRRRRGRMVLGPGRLGHA